MNALMVETSSMSLISVEFTNDALGSLSFNTRNRALPANENLITREWEWIWELSTNTVFLFLQVLELLTDNAHNICVSTRMLCAQTSEYAIYKWMKWISVLKCTRIGRLKILTFTDYLIINLCSIIQLMHHFTLRKKYKNIISLNKNYCKNL